jgi:hypothetical protein
MNADMLSEILLLVSASVLLVTLLLILAARADANRCAEIARPCKGKAMRQVHNSAAITLAIILLGIPARSQSAPSSHVSANDRTPGDY